MNQFRYLEKFVGTYRVKSYYDEATGDFPKVGREIDPSFDDLYIPCAKGEIRHTYKPGHILAWFNGELSLDQAKSIKSKLERAKVKLEFDIIGDDSIIYFDESYLPQVAKVVKPVTIGKGIPPFDKRNLPGKNEVADEYVIPEEDLKLYSEALTKLADNEKLRLCKKWLKEFDEVIKSKPKHKNVEDEREESGLPPKLFIHYIGMWKPYVAFTKKKVNEYVKEKKNKCK